MSGVWKGERIPGRNARAQLKHWAADEFAAMAAGIPGRNARAQLKPDLKEGKRRLTRGIPGRNARAQLKPQKENAESPDSTNVSRAEMPGPN